MHFVKLSRIQNSPKMKADRQSRHEELQQYSRRTPKFETAGRILTRLQNDDVEEVSRCQTWILELFVQIAVVTASRQRGDAL